MVCKLGRITELSYDWCGYESPRTQMRKGMKSPIAGAVCFLVLAAGAAPSFSAARNGPALSSIKELMESIIDPSADVVWGAVGTVVDQAGVHESSPKTDEEWLEVRRAVVRIIEGANLLMMPGREAAPPGTKSEAPGVELEPVAITALVKKNRKAFDAFANALQTVALEALRASDARNTAMLLEVGALMENVCESCHQAFWYPQEKRPGR
jgi:hypothetical protein